MNEKNNLSLYEQIRDFTQKFTYEIEPGISVEIRDFFQDHQGIKEYKVLLTEGNCYTITVRLEQFNRQQIKGLFLSFLHFLEYSTATVYAKKETKNGIHYFLASFMESGKGFCCAIDFIV